MPLHLTDRDLDRLAHLRDTLLALEGRAPGVPAPRYWESDRDLDLYDRTFGRRIAMKWRAVLDVLEARGALAPAERVLDWGCGPGVAARAWMERSGAREVVLWDRDPRARAFAARAVQAVDPAARVEAAERPPTGAFDLVLVSHVLDELDEPGVAELLEVLRGARRVVWVEPGSRRTASRLSEARERLLDRFTPLAPCTHTAACGALRSAVHWCHFFAEPDPEVFTDGGWARFGAGLGIDLRSVPYSYLALEVDPSEERRPTGGARVLGRARVQRGRALVDLCDAAGVAEVVLLQRFQKDLLRTLERPRGRSLVLDVLERGGHLHAAERAR